MRRSRALLLSALSVPIVAAVRLDAAAGADAPTLGPDRPMAQAPPVPLCRDAAFAAVWTARSLEKVFVTDRPPASTGPISLAAARDEHSQTQLVVMARQQLSNVTIALTGTEDDDDGDDLVLDVKLVEFVDVKAAVNPANRTGLFPDPLPLIPRGGATLNASQGAAPFWVTLTPGPTARAGTRKALALELRTSAGRCAVPLTLRVYDFSVANRTQLTDSGLRVQRGLDRFFDREKGSPAEVVQRYSNFMAEYRVNQKIFHSVYPYMVASWAPDRSDVSLDTDAFDTTIQGLLDRGLQSFRFPSPANATMSGNEGNVSHTIIAPIWVAFFQECQQ